MASGLYKEVLWTQLRDVVMRNQTLNILLKFTFPPLGLLAEQDREGLWRARGGVVRGHEPHIPRGSRQESQLEGCKLDKRKDFPLAWGIGSEDMGQGEWTDLFPLSLTPKR